MKKEMKIGIIGFGNMGEACARALAEKCKVCVFIYDKDRKKTRNKKNFCICRNIEELIKNVEVVILAIKPQDAGDFLIQAKAHLLQKSPLFISILAGISTKAFEKHLGGVRVIRVMPNVAAKVKESVSFICKGKFSKKGDLKIAEEIFSSLGETIEVKESYLDKVTSISGSGPGYIYYFMDCLYGSAITLGFSKAIARKMVINTFLGAASLAKAGGSDFKTLIKQVASKGGTTQAALEVFEKNNLKSLINKAVGAAHLRAKQLSKN